MRENHANYSSGFSIAFQSTGFDNESIGERRGLFSVERPIENGFEANHQGDLSPPPVYKLL